MELIKNFVESQTLFGVFGILAFLSICVAILRKFARAEKGGWIFIFAPIPIVFDALAVIANLAELRHVINARSADIINPDAIVGISIEILVVGVIETGIIFVLLTALKMRTE